MCPDNSQSTSKCSTGTVQRLATNGFIKIIRRPGFWLIFLVMVLITLPYYHEVFKHPTFISDLISALGLERHAFERILYLAPIVWSSIIFGRNGAFIVATIALACMLPRAVFVSATPSDAIFESVAVFIVGIVMSVTIDSLRKERKRRTLLTTLNQTSSDLSQSLDLNQVLRSSIDSVIGAMNIDAAMVFLLDEQAGALILAAYQGISENLEQQISHFKVGEGFNGQVAQTGEALYVEDVSKEVHYTTKAVEEEGIRSQLILPLKSKGNVVGTLCIASHSHRQFQPDEIELVTAVCNQMATNIENARLFEKEIQTAKRLATSERRLRLLFENASDAIWVNDLSGNIKIANEATAKLTGYSVEELVNMNARDFLPDEERKSAVQIRGRLLGNEPLDELYEKRLVKKDGAEAIVKVASNLNVENGRPTGFQNIARDVTADKRAEEVLKRSEWELSQIIGESSIPTIVINDKHIVTHWNRSCENLTGVPASEVVGTSKQGLAFYSEARPIMADLIVDNATETEIDRYYHDKYSKSGLIEEAYEAEDFFPHLGDHGKWLFFTAAPLRDDDGNIYGAIETLQDITERKEADEALKKMQANLVYYLQQITKAQEDERQRIARELHDETIQDLVVLSRQLDELVTSAKGLPEEDKSLLESLWQQTNNIMNGVRRLSQDLRPPTLDRLGLVPALEWLASNVSQGSGIEIEVKTRGNARRFSAEVELLLFRIVQEALSNVWKHSKATSAEVMVDFDDKNTRITIKDNGQGFDLPTSVGDLPGAGKLGLAGIQERANLLRGSVKIASEPGKGTKIGIEVPV